MRFNTSDEAFAKIESLTNLEKAPNLTAREYRLDRMFRLTELFGQPQNAFRSIHVAGSKGKGSTAAFIAASLKANGYRTGLYCSPHVSSYKERISESRVFFDDRIYAETASEMFDTIEAETSFEDFPGGAPTTFELLTLLSFLIFKKTGCEWAVFETGLGGRLDATNVIRPEASVLTVIELEHTEYLGDTLTAIAGEKAGIIKPGVPVFSADQHPDAEAVFRKRAEQNGSRIFFPGDLIDSCTDEKAAPPYAQAFRIGFTDNRSCSISLRSAGDFQIKNAALAAVTLKTIMPDTYEPAAGFADTALPGRMELLYTPGGIPVMLDGAHTIESVTAASEGFRKTVPESSDGSVLIFGAVKGKDVEGMASRLNGFSKIIISTPGSFKPNCPEDVYTVFKSIHKSVEIELIKDPSAALADAVSRELPVLVLGSFYMVAEIRPFFS